MVQRANPPLKGAWTLPGGKLDGGESIAEGVEREIFEETGIRVFVGDLVQVVEVVTEGFHYVIHDHLCTPLDPSENPRPGGDATAARYVRTSELPSLGATEEVARVVMRALAMRHAGIEDE
jgi:ADP-ribose pyrophosphatase YjhB (NUDIX family)